jgi:PAS domain S-box-containing protein
MQQSLNALIVDDREHDAALLVRALKRGGYDLHHERVDNEDHMMAALARQAWDIVLTDYSMPNFNVAGALSVIAKAGIDIPLVVVSGSVGEETAVEVMRAGAHDLILKHNLKRLVPVVARELEAAKIRRARRAADTRLDFERQLLTQLMQGIPDAICFKDSQRRYIHLNNAERTFFNIPDGTPVIGDTADAFIASGLAERQREEETRVLESGEPLVDCAYEIVGPDGQARWISATKAPTRGTNGEIVGLVEISRDITEKKRQEQLKNEFIATVSHELRTPLTSIMGSIAVLESGKVVQIPPAAGRLLQIALDNCRRLVGIVNDILDIEKIEAGKMSFDFRPVDICALVDQVAQASRGMADQHAVSVRVEHAAPAGMLFTDPDRLAQVITNLVSNAIKFSPANAVVLVCADQSDARIRITVRDHGPGIPSAYRDRIFEKFVQVDATDHRKRGGTGLGLSIARQITTQLGGSIGFEDAVGGGTIFEIVLPLRAPAAGDRGANEARVTAPAF